tara:strand:+ start:552 stop:1481 length:930 start_codon:yes stop_codon:yes gene_type:complete
MLLLVAMFTVFTYSIFNLWVVVFLLGAFSVRFAWMLMFAVKSTLKECAKHAPIYQIDHSEYPALVGTIERCAISAGIPVPRTYIWDVESMNAFTLGRSVRDSIIVVHRGLMANVTPTELKGIIGHEMAHIVNGDVFNQAFCGIFCDALAFQAKWFTRIGQELMKVISYRGKRRNNDGVNVLGVIIVLAIGIPCLIVGVMAQGVSVLAHLILFKLSRTRELRADYNGAFLVRDTEALINGLSRLAEYSEPDVVTRSARIRQLSTVNEISKHSGDGVLTVFSDALLRSHPDTEFRIERLRRNDPNKRETSS